MESPNSLRHPSGCNEENPINIGELLNCYICYGKVKNAVMCPQCSKLCCEQCIKVNFYLLLEMDHRAKVPMSTLQSTIATYTIGELPIC